MGLEEDVHEFLTKYCYTTFAEMDPCKPFILDGDLVKPNPAYDPEIAHYRGNPGTSFFFNFDCDCSLHQGSGELGEWARAEIARQVHERVIEVFVAQFPDDPPPLEPLKEALEIAINSNPQLGFNNGEIYAWLRGLPLKEELVFTLLKELKHSFEEKRITVNVKGKDYQAWFYGWGFRYY